MKNNHRIISIFLLAVMLMFAACGEKKDVPEDTISSNYNENSGITVGELEKSVRTQVVLVMDESGSMRKADKERMAIEGAKLFVDMEKMTNASIGLVEFSNGIVSSGMLDVSVSKNKSVIKNTLENVEYVPKNHTDTGAGLMEAVQMLDEDENNNNKSILLFTDGNTDIDAGTPGRTLQDSLDDVESAIQIAKEKGYKIYCIGLNQNGDVDETELAHIAQETGGDYLIATDVSSMTEFFERIFAQIGNADIESIDEYTADGDYHTVTFDIDNANVLEANIVILSSKTVEDVRLVDVNGNQVDLENTQNVSFSRSSKYTVIKLRNPEPGKWSVSVKGVEGDAIRIGRIFNYDLNLVVGILQKTVQVSSGWTVNMYFTSNGNRMYDKDFYSSLEATVTVENKDTGEIKEEKMTYQEWENGDNLQCALFANIVPDKAGSYILSVFVQGNGFYRKSEDIEVYAEKNHVEYYRNIEDLVLKKGEEKEINLDNYFREKDKGEIQYSVEVGSDKVSATLSGNILTVRCDDYVSTNMIIYADNGVINPTRDNVNIFCKEPVNYTGIILKILFYVIGITAIITLIIVLVIRGKQLMSGAFRIVLRSNHIKEDGTPEEKIFDIPVDIAAQKVGKHGFKIDDLLQIVSEYYNDLESDNDEDFKRCMTSIKPEADKVYVRGSNNNNEFTIINKSEKVKFVENMNAAKKQSLKVSLNNKSAFGNLVTEKKIGIRFYTDDAENYEEIDITYKRY